MKLLPAVTDVPALAAFDVVAEAAAPVVVVLAPAALAVVDTDTVIAPAPRPPPLATGAVVTVEKLVTKVEFDTPVVVVDGALADWEAVLELPDPDPDPDEDEDEEPAGALPSVLMLCQDPDMSP